MVSSSSADDIYLILWSYFAVALMSVLCVCVFEATLGLVMLAIVNWLVIARLADHLACAIAAASNQQQQQLIDV